MTNRASVFLLASALAGCATSQPAQHALPVSLPDLTTYALVQTDAGRTAPRVVTAMQAADVLVAYDVIIVGESHRHPGNHLAEMALFRDLHERVPSLSLSMEQLERDVQPVVDDYLAGKIGEASFLERSRPWNNYATSYRPLVEFAKEHHLPVIAANAPEKVVRCIGREGVAVLDRMKSAERPWVAAELHLEDGAYKDKFMGFVRTEPTHGGDAARPETAGRPTPSPEAMRSFAAQVSRDDTMAESIFLHLQKNPGRKVFHITGSFHAEAFLGTVERLKARAPQLKIAVVTPKEITDAKPVNIANVEAASGTFVLLIRAMPEPYANENEMKAAIAKQMAARRESKCEM